MRPAPLRKCGYCGEERAFVDSGHRLHDGSRVYWDHQRRRWSGKRCPDCERARVKKAIRCDDFDRHLIEHSLVAQGYKPVRRGSRPFTVEKDGQTLTVGVRRARIEGERVHLDQAGACDADIVVLLFESARILSKAQFQTLQNGATQGQNPQASGKRTERRNTTEGDAAPL